MKKISLTLVFAIMFVMAAPKKAEAGMLEGALIGAAIGAIVGLIIHLSKPKETNKIDEDTQSEPSEESNLIENETIEESSVDENELVPQE